MNSAGIGGYFQGSTPAVVKSIQAFSIDLNGAVSNTATISAVVTANSLLIYGGHSVGNAGTDPSLGQAKLALTNATTVTATRNSSDANTTPVNGTVVELTSGVLKSNQSGTIDLNNVTSATATISSVSTAKAYVAFLGRNEGGTGGNYSHTMTKLALTNATTVTASNQASNAVTMPTGYQVPEYAL